MADLVRLAYYPFLPEVREAVREAGPNLEELLRSPLYEGVRMRAAQRVEGALGEGFPAAQIDNERSALTEILSVPVARMLCVLLNDKILISRYADAEAARAHQHLKGDRDPEAVPAAAAALGLETTDADPAPDGPRWKMHMSRYLAAAPRDTEWKLIMQTLDRGQVILDRPAMCRLCEEALSRRIVQDLEAELKKPANPDVETALGPLVERLRPRLEEAREGWSSGDFGPVQPGLFPPCIKELFEAMKRGENIPHHGRFAFATFLGTIGFDAAQILDYLSSTPNFDREKSRYQIEHVTGERGVEKYTPPGCATMQTNGVCPLEKRDGLCFKIKHPLSYYRAKLRFQQRDDAKLQTQPGASLASVGPAVEAKP